MTSSANGLSYFGLYRRFHSAVFAGGFELFVSRPEDVDMVSGRPVPTTTCLLRAHSRLRLPDDQRNSARLADSLAVAEQNWLTVCRDAFGRDHEMRGLATRAAAQRATGDDKT